MPPSENPQSQESQSLTRSAERSKFPLLLEFWVVLLLPWILDSYSTRAVLISVFGATLWGIALALSVARARTRDERFRTRQGWALLAVSLLWLGYWIYSFGEMNTSAGLESPRPGAMKWLLISHAGLLAAGAGMVAVLWIAALMWILQDRSLRLSSWERRRTRWRLPSLEALGKVAKGTMDGAFISWGLGFFLAMMSGILRWRSDSLGTGLAAHLGWITDTKVLATALLWVLLVAGFQAGHLVSPAKRWLYYLYLGVGTLFWFGFIYGLMMGHHSVLHEPVSWFLQ